MSREQPSEFPELAAAVAFPYPATPDMTSPVLNRIRSERQSRAVDRRRLVAAGAVAAAIAGAGAVALSPGSRSAVADFLGLAVEGERIETAPTSAVPTAIPTIEPADTALAVTLAGASEAVGFELALPGGREPERVYLFEVEQWAVAVLHYPDFDLWQFTPNRPSVAKTLFGGDELVEEVRVGGVPAYWIGEGLRLVEFERPDGTKVASMSRLVETPVLVWTRDGVYFRLETEMDREAALEVAESIVPGN